MSPIKTIFKEFVFIHIVKQMKSTSKREESRNQEKKGNE